MYTQLSSKGFHGLYPRTGKQCITDPETKYKPIALHIRFSLKDALTGN